jgi:hypothetical protein
MSDEQFLPDQPALMSPIKARNIARSLKYLAEQYADARMPRQATRTMQDSQWWMTYALSLSQTPPGAIDKEG